LPEKAGKIAKQAQEHPDTVEHNYVAGSGLSLPHPDGIFDEVLMRNVIGDPSIVSGVKDRMIDESFRVLRPDGVVIVAEHYTPHVASRCMPFLGGRGDLESGVINHDFTTDLYEPGSEIDIQSYPRLTDFFTRSYIGEGALRGAFIAELKPVSQKFQATTTRIKA